MKGEIFRFMGAIGLMGLATVFLLAIGEYEPCIKLANSILYGFCAFGSVIAALWLLFQPSWHPGP